MRSIDHESIFIVLKAEFGTYPMPCTKTMQAQENAGLAADDFFETLRSTEYQVRGS